MRVLNGNLLIEWTFSFSDTKRHSCLTTKLTSEADALESVLRATNGPRFRRRQSQLIANQAVHSLSLLHPVNQLIRSINCQQRSASCLLLLLLVSALPPPSDHSDTLLFCPIRSFFPPSSFTSLFGVIERITLFMECLWVKMIVTEKKISMNN